MNFFSKKDLSSLLFWLTIVSQIFFSPNSILALSVKYQIAKRAFKDSQRDPEMLKAKAQKYPQVKRPKRTETLIGAHLDEKIFKKKLIFRIILVVLFLFIAVTFFSVATLKFSPFSTLHKIIFSLGLIFTIFFLLQSISLYIFIKRHKTDEIDTKFENILMTVTFLLFAIVTQIIFITLYPYKVILSLFTTLYMCIFISVLISLWDKFMTIRKKRKTFDQLMNEEEQNFNLFVPPRENEEQDFNLFVLPRENIEHRAIENQSSNSMILIKIAFVIAFVGLGFIAIQNIFAPHLSPLSLIGYSFLGVSGVFLTIFLYRHLRKKLKREPSNVFGRVSPLKQNAFSLLSFSEYFSKEQFAQINSFFNFDFQKVLGEIDSVLSQNKHLGFENTSLEILSALATDKRFYKNFCIILEHMALLTTDDFKRFQETQNLSDKLSPEILSIFEAFVLFAIPLGLLDEKTGSELIDFEDNIYKKIYDQNFEEWHQNDSKPNLPKLFLEHIQEVDPQKIAQMNENFINLKQALIAA